MCAKKRQPDAKANAAPEDSLIARNKKARFEYEVLDTFEAGLVLLGSEVKSLRNGDVSLSEAFVRPRDGELWLLGMNIKQYKQATIVNHDPLRPRKVLMHKKEVARLLGKVAERGFTVVPLRLYWKRGMAKVQIALVRGKRLYDKRDSIKKREVGIEMRRAARHRNR